MEGPTSDNSEPNQISEAIDCVGNLQRQSSDGQYINREESVNHRHRLPASDPNAPIPLQGGGTARDAVSASRSWSLGDKEGAGVGNARLLLHTSPLYPHTADCRARGTPCDSAAAVANLKVELRDEPRHPRHPVVLRRSQTLPAVSKSLSEPLRHRQRMLGHQTSLRGKNISGDVTASQYRRTYSVAGMTTETAEVNNQSSSSSVLRCTPPPGTAPTSSAAAAAAAIPRIIRDGPATEPAGNSKRSDSTTCTPHPRIRQQTVHSVKPHEPTSFFKTDTTDESVLRDWHKISAKGFASYFQQNPKYFKRKVSRGVPNSVRWEVWKVLLIERRRGHVSFEVDPTNSSATTAAAAARHRRNHNSANAAPIVFDLLKAQEDSEFSDLIRIDKSRTFPDLPAFDEAAQEKLYYILNLYALHHPSIGYCQGMNFVAGFLLLMSNFHLAESYEMFVILMENYSLHGLFRDNFPLLFQYVEVFGELAQLHIPKLKLHFQKEGVIPPMYLHQWLLTLFVTCLPLQTVAIIWDHLIAQDLHVLLPLSVTLLKVLTPVLIKYSFEKAVKFLKSLRESGSEDEARIGRNLIKHAHKISIPPDLLKTIVNVDMEKLSQKFAASRPTPAALAPPIPSRTGTGGGFLANLSYIPISVYPFTQYFAELGATAQMVLGAEVLSENDPSDDEAHSSPHQGSAPCPTPTQSPGKQTLQWTPRIRQERISPSNAAGSDSRMHIQLPASSRYARHDTRSGGAYRPLAYPVVDHVGHHHQGPAMTVAAAARHLASPATVVNVQQDDDGSSSNVQQRLSIKTAEMSHRGPQKRMGGRLGGEARYH